MFDTLGGRGTTLTAPEPSRAGTTVAPTLGDLRDTLTALRRLDGAGAPEAELIDQLTAMEQLKGALAAAQARVTVTLDQTRAEAEADRGIPAERRCRGLGAEIALARHDSPHRGARHLGMARALVHEMPHTLAALSRGEISEWRATIMVRETAVLSRADRRQVDTELAGKLATMGDRQVAAAARRIGYRLDPGSAIRRVRGANSDRHVGLRPAPDTMSYLTGFLPVAQGVACLVALTQYADTLRAQGDPRTKGQIMADALVERLTGRATASGTPVEVGLVITDKALLGGDDTPAELAGYGPIPAALARQLVRDADKAWLRRLFTRPADGTLTGIDARRRRFTGRLRKLLVLRDQTCRTPWCDAPIRHLDHPRRVADGGPTSAENSQGLCEACNYAKEHPGWQSRHVPDPRHRIDVTTPTGHHYPSRAPNPVDTPPAPSAMETWIRTVLDAA